MKALISITTCKRLSDVKKYVWDYLNFVNSNKDYHFVLALDGNEQEYLDFCDIYNIPLVYSQEREGVGLSKNRVLSQFPNYDYYFFIEDDVELVDGSVFKEIIDMHKLTSHHHFCGNTNHVLVDEKFIEKQILQFSMRGGGYFNFFSQKGVGNVGGFNTIFAKYLRFGHTEYSYRFYHKELQPAPFIFSPAWYNKILLHTPKSVTKLSNLNTNQNELIEDEQELIDNKTTYFPLTTLSIYFFNDKQLGHNEKVEKFLKDNPQKYPLTKGKERRQVLGEFFALKIQKNRNSHYKNLLLAIKSMFYSPMNSGLKHKIKFYFKK